MFRSTFIVAALCLFGVVIEAKPKKKCTEQIADIMFVLDSSSSIWIRHYREQLQFVASLVDTFGVGKGDSQIRIGAITFSNESHLEFPLGHYNKPSQLKKAILSIPHRHGDTNTADALSLLKEQVEPNLKTNKGPTVAIVITDGYSSDPDATKEEARKLHELGVTVYVIGVGDSSRYDINELKAIASDPENGVYTVSSYSELKKIRKTFSVQVCEGETITPKPTTTTTTTVAPTTTTIEDPTTTTTTVAPTTSTIKDPTTTTTTPAPATTISNSDKKPNDEPSYPEKDPSSIILFGYDLLAAGAYGSSMIHQFIYTLLPYTGYGHFGIVSYGYCPSNLDVEITSLMGKDMSTVKDSIVADGKLPDLAAVIRKMRKMLSSRSDKNNKHYIENQVAVVFIDLSTTTITPELTKEIEMLKKNGVKLYLVNVGLCLRQQNDQLYCISSQPYDNYIFSAPSYHQLLLRAQRNTHYFKPMYNRRVPILPARKSITLY